MQKLKPIIFFLVVGAVAGYFVYEEATRTGPRGRINIGDEAPEFTLKDKDGRDVKLSDFRGKLVLLNFWATWCVPCRTEAPELEVLHKTFKNTNFQVLGVSIDLDWDVVKKFDEELRITFPSVLDPAGQRVARGLYRITGQPESFLISPEGRVLKYFVGPERWSSPAVVSQIEALIPDSAAAQTSQSN